jgi:hypothetical protein
VITKSEIISSWLGVASVSEVLYFHWNVLLKPSNGSHILFEDEYELREKYVFFRLRENNSLSVREVAGLEERQRKVSTLAFVCSFSRIEKIS